MHVGHQNLLFSAGGGSTGRVWRPRGLGALVALVALVWAAPAAQAWYRVPGGLAQISVGNKDQVWGVAKDHSILRWTGMTWDRVPGALINVSVGGDGTVWGIKPSNMIFQLVSGTWKEMPGRLVQISVGSKGHVWGVSRDQAIWRWTGKYWDRVPGLLTNVSVGADGTVWGVNAGGIIFQRVLGKWTQVPGRLKQISVGSKDHVWGVAKDASIWRWTGQTWARVPGGLKWVSVGHDGAVWGTNRRYEIYRAAPPSPAEDCVREGVSHLLKMMGIPSGKVAREEYHRREIGPRCARLGNDSRLAASETYMWHEISSVIHKVNGNQRVSSAYRWIAPHLMASIRHSFDNAKGPITNFAHLWRTHRAAYNFEFGGFSHRRPRALATTQTVDSAVQCADLCAASKACRMFKWMPGPDSGNGGARSSCLLWKGWTKTLRKFLTDPQTISGMKK